jgi:hypothetical protein
MSRGVDLKLFIGPAVPVPAPRAAIDALEKVQVQVNSGDTASGFELTFSLSKRSPLQTLFLLTGGSSIPIMRVVIMVTMGAMSEVIMDGVMTHHEVRPGADGGKSSLVVKGKDLTALMDFIELNGIPFPAMSPAIRVLTILAKYAAFGVVPMVIPGVVEDLPIPVERIPTQQGSDLAYVSRLARESGYVFYMEPLPVPGTVRAYWGPEIKVGAPQPALNTDMDAFTNSPMSSRCHSVLTRTRRKCRSFSSRTRPARFRSRSRFPISRRSIRRWARCRRCRPSSSSSTIPRSSRPSGR